MVMRSVSLRTTYTCDLSTCITSCDTVGVEYCSLPVFKKKSAFVTRNMYALQRHRMGDNAGYGVSSLRIVSWLL